MAGKMEGGDRRFSVVIELRASAMCCTAYFAHPDRITYCAICGCIPDVLHILDNDAPLCKRCFRGAVGSNPLKGTSETVTPQWRLGSVTCNEAFRDAFVTCPECGRTGRYVKFKEHIKAVHPQLWHCGQQQQAYNAQRGKEVGPPPGFQSQHQADVKPFDVNIDMEELQNCTEKSAPQEAATITLPSDCEVTFQTGCGHTSISSAEKGGQETGKRANSESKTDECTSFSKCLDPNRTEPEGRPTLEPKKTTAAMSFKEKYSLKDVKGVADGIRIPFKEKLNPELACCICKALTPSGLKDGKGHTYCAYCTRVHTDALGRFTCSLCGWQAAPSDMSSNGEEWGILEKLIAACPNDNPKCTYQGTFKDVLVHYKSCALKTKVECPLCKSLHDRKTLATHMAENCPKRVVECKFCNSDIEAWEKEIHEGSCRHRPGTCKYCLQEFSTIIELEEEHQPQCPKMPVKCSFYQLGCSFSAARSDVVVHEATTKHTDILMEHVCLLKAENESLKRRIENQEKKFRGIIDNIKDFLPKIENGTNVVSESLEARSVRYNPLGLNPYQTAPLDEASPGTRRREIEERLADVEEKLRSYQLPFEQLLRSISRLQ